MEPNRWQHSQRVEVLRAGQWRAAVYMDRGETTGLHYAYLEGSFRWVRVRDDEIREPKR